MSNDNILEVKNLKKYFPIKSGVFQKVVGHVKSVDGVSFENIFVYGKQMTSLEECRIKAPFDGTVSDVLVEQGIQVNPGTAILKLVDLSTIEVSIPVPEGEIGKIRIGQKALIDVPALNIEGIEAHVKLKGVTAASPSHTYRCTLVPEKKQTDLYPGMVCKVRLSEVSDSLRIRIPASSVEMDSNGKFVWVVNDGVVGRKYVTVDGYQEQGVVISSGLEPGDKIIVKGAAKVSTGMKVNSIEQES